MKVAAAFAVALVGLLLEPAPATAATQGGAAMGSAGPAVRHHVVRFDAVRLAFMRQHACPATGQFTTDCPGWRVEYIVPPERGGEHAVSNMKWERTDVTRPAD